MLTAYGEERTKMIAFFRQCAMKDLTVLQSLSRKTFFETFADVNTSENMTAYLDKAFAPEKLRDCQIQLRHFTFCTGTAVLPDT